MKEPSLSKKILYISRAVQVLIVNNSEASKLLERLKQERGYEVVQDVNYDYPEASTGGVIGRIVINDGGAHIIYSADGVIEVLSAILSHEKANAAEHSPPVSRAQSYQGSGGQPPKVTMSGEGTSVDLEYDSEVVLNGFVPEPKPPVKWCSWFRDCCCSSSAEKNPLLTPETERKLTK